MDAEGGGSRRPLLPKHNIAAHHRQGELDASEYRHRRSNHLMAQLIFGFSC